MGALVLPDQIPPDVRAQFEKLKALFSDGLFKYESFTFADRDSYRVLEVALKVRFLEHYGRQLPITRDGHADLYPVASFGDVYELFSGRSKHPRVRLVGHPMFSASLGSLLRWARAERYLYGQGNRIREGATLSLRNDMQHTEHDLLLMPPDAQRSVHHTFEMICRLWAYDPVPAMTYPGLVHRVPCVVGLGPQEGEAIWCPLEHPESGVKDRDADNRTWYLVLAFEVEELGRWRPLDLELTSAPVRILWGPGSWDDLHAEIRLSAGGWPTDSIEILDRLFYFRVRDDQIDLPRSAESVQRMKDRDRSERWLVVRADGPGGAFAHARDAVSGSHPLQGPCPKCPAEGILPLARRDTIDRFLRDIVPGFPVPRRHNC
jgi:hypothetical protein